ncbi:metal-dependent hydrolase [Nocardiopsis synnemataformans]|uniref:metal-dependent hydrolase n=1 Tax=Nocardiopsis synnemataformans TaxID=61305 RepID=UPI003EBEFB1A
MGASHAASGAFVAAAAAAAWPTPVTLGDVVTVGAVAAGATLLPDLDSRSSTASNCLGPVTRGASSAVRALSRMAWRWTATDYDRSGRGQDRGHRHLNHTPVAALGWGVLAAAASAQHPLAPVALAAGLGALGVATIVRSIPKWKSYSTVAGAGAAAAAVAVQWEDPTFGPFTVGLLVAAGMVIGILGDWLTPTGVPLAWPAQVNGKRWWQHHSPWTFPTGDDSWQEKWIRRMCWIGTPVAIIFAVLE